MYLRNILFDDASQLNMMQGDESCNRSVCCKGLHMWDVCSDHSFKDIGPAQILAYRFNQDWIQESCIYEAVNNSVKHRRKRPFLDFSGQPIGTPYCKKAFRRKSDMYATSLLYDRCLWWHWFESVGQTSGFRWPWSAGWSKRYTSISSR